MNLLLDTHAFLWWIGNDSRLPQRARDLISSPDNQVFLSVVSAWELAIKIQMGKLDLRDDLDHFLPEQLQRNGFNVLPIALPHALNLQRLPKHHRDPFDRMLISQAQCEGLTVVSCDTQFRSYDVRIV